MLDRSRGLRHLALIILVMSTAWIDLWMDLWLEADSPLAPLGLWREAWICKDLKLKADSTISVYNTFVHIATPPIGLRRIQSAPGDLLFSGPLKLKMINQSLSQRPQSRLRTHKIRPQSRNGKLQTLPVTRAGVGSNQVTQSGRGKKQPPTGKLPRHSLLPRLRTYICASAGSFA